MNKRKISALIAVLVTLTVTTTAYARDNVLGAISAGAEKKVSVSSDSSMKIVSDTEAKPAAKSAAKSTEIKAGAEATISSDSDVAASEAKPATSDTEASESTDSASENSSDGKEVCVANVEDSMNVRAEASEDASVVGYMYKDCVGEILERKDGWTKIRSGNLEGWAKDDYLIFGDEAKAKTDGAMVDIAVINADKLRIRAEASEEAEVKAMLTEGDEVEVISTDEDDWTKISFEDGTSGSDTGYVSNDYITIKTVYKSGETIEEVKEREEKSKEAREESEKKDKEERKSEVKSSDNSDSAAVEISEEELNAASSEKTEAAVTNNGGISASTDDETLLAALIQCECNGPYEAQLAVGAVVVNRANGGYGSISNAIYAPYQFGPASSGKLARTLSSGAISATARQAAHDAINGVSNVGNARYFRNVSSGHAGIVIGNHVYW